MITLFLLLVLVDLFIFTVLDRYFLSLFVFVLLVAGLWWIEPSAFSWVTTLTLKQAIVGIVGYISIGIGVAGIKWLFVSMKIGTRLREVRGHFENKYVPTTRRPEGVSRSSLDDDRASSVKREKTPQEKREEFLQYVRDHHRYERDVLRYLSVSIEGKTEEDMIAALTPSARHNADRITAWIFQWPFVVIGVLVEDILIKIGHWVSEVFQAMFTNISRKFVSDAVKGL